MPVQSQLFPEPKPPAAEIEPVRVAPLWLQRMSLGVLVLFCLYLGALVAALPWWPRIWDDNPFLFAHPRVYEFLHIGAVRGVISGLGLLDIWIGISEAVHYRDHGDER